MLEKLESSRGCFVCGNPELENPRSLGVVIFWDTDKKTTVIPIHPDNTWNGYPGVVHGGIIAAVMDDAMAWSVFKTSGKWGVTAKMSLRYRKAMKTGVEYTVKGKVTSITGKKVATESVIFDYEGNKIAESNALFILNPNVNGDEVE
ncbi:MAG: PaaI family thioesterase [Synergistales bacterium]|nr:PaaI family thioesterase [Synergistales bacterium]